MQDGVRGRVRFVGVVEWQWPTDEPAHHDDVDDEYPVGRRSGSRRVKKRPRTVT
jgi:hypothetical protein